MIPPFKGKKPRRIFYVNAELETGGRKYQFKTHFSDLIEGDSVIVDTRYGMKYATFVEYLPRPTLMKYHGDGSPPELATDMIKRVIAKVDPYEF